MADKWILSHYAAADRGGISRLGNAKADVQCAAQRDRHGGGGGLAAFFSTLFAQERFFDFNAAVNKSVSRLLAVSLLVSAWMTALAVPLMDLYRGGRLTHEEAASMAQYFLIFSLSLALWSAQGIYARAFYAARNTLVPAISGTVITLLSIPIYALCFHRLGVAGLAVASDLGILAHTVALAVLLHRHRLVSLACLDFPEIGRAGLAALVAWLAASEAVRLPHPHSHYLGDTIQLSLATLAWGVAAVLALKLSGSRLVEQVLNRKAKS